MAVPTVHLLDYIAGNVRSLVNAIEKLGFNVEWIKEPADVSKAEVRNRFFLNISFPTIHMSS
jgi:imidazoleglycerol phosphate synthase glutamine amidotransferase subunit HisH